MSNTRFCSECGAEIGNDTPSGQCARCLMKLALEQETECSPEMATEAQFFEEPGALIGRYKLLEKVGEGGFGTVWAAEQREPVRRRVALKIIKLGMDTKQVVARFEAERQALALMDHPNIAKVLDGGTTDTGRPYFVMELVRGIPVTKYCEQERLPTPERLGLFIKVCQAVQHSHQKGVIHRDIKPSNILVTLHDGVPVPKVIDFGIAKATQGELTEKTIYTRLQQFIGTPAYMSPEQAEMSGLDIDTRSDIYSLGVLLYELLTGKTPFETKELLQAGFDELRRVIREKEPMRPSTRLRSMDREELTSTARTRQIEAVKLIHLLGGDLDWIAMQCLEKDRTRRYETASGLAADIQRHLNNEVVTARPPSAGYRLRKAWRRNKLAFTTGTAVALALLAGAAVSTWQAIEANRARSAEREQRLRAQEAQWRAEEERQRAAAAFERIALEDAGAQVEAGNISSALAVLGGILRRNPDNVVAAQLAGSVLLHENHILPSAPPITHESQVTWTDFSPDGQSVLTMCEDGAARLWDTRTSELQHTLRSSQEANLGNPSPVIFGGFSPDGQRIATAFRDQTAALWDRGTGERLHWLRHDSSPANVVRWVRFSPDGKRLVAACDDGTVWLWEVETGQPLGPPWRHENSVIQAEFDPEGRRVVSASWDGTARIWDVGTGRLLVTLQHESGERSAQVRHARFSPDGRLVTTTTWDNQLYLWQASEGDLLWRGVRSGYDPAFSPDGRKLISGGGTEAIIRDVATGREEYSLPHLGWVEFVAFAPEGRQAATASGDNRVRLWNPLTGKLLAVPRFHSGPVFAAHFSPDGARLLTAARDEGRTAQVWNVDFVRHQSGLPIGRREPVQFARFVGDGNVMTIDTSGWVEIYEAESGRALGAGWHLDQPALHMALSADQREVMVYSADLQARFFDLMTGQPACDPFLLGVPAEEAWFSQNGERVVLVDEQNERKARLWEVRSGREIGPGLELGAPVQAGWFTGDGRWLALAGENYVLTIWDADRGTLEARERGYIDAQGYILDAEFAPDNSYLLVTSANVTRLVERPTGFTQYGPFYHDQPVTLVRFNHDGTHAATVTQDGTVRLWDVFERKLLAAPMQHPSAVSQVDFSPDGSRLLIISADFKVRLRDVPSGHLIHIPLQHESPVRFGQFSPDGRSVLTVAENAPARLWKLTGIRPPVPPWFPAVAEAVGGRRANAAGIEEPVSTSELLELKAQILEGSDTRPFSKLAARLFGESNEGMMGSP